MSNQRLGVGFIGSGFIARFHIQSWIGLRDADVLGVWSPNPQNAASAAALARELDVGEARPYASISEMVADPAIDAIWLTGPNHARVENVEEIVHAIESGQGTLKAIACEKPLARNVAEAEHVTALVKRAGLMHGYLEDQLFTPHVERGRDLIWARGAATTGRPFLARAAEEHSGPHAPWFWQGHLQGGGVLNDMMCHSVLLVRHLLARPGEPLSTVRPVRLTGHIASLKWTRPEYVERLKQEMGPEVDYARAPTEDFASLTIEFETDDGYTVLGEVSTSWSFVG
ncbi:MAG: Gfo/Idh/MocA family oxidoreductase, partial [Gemmatimonadetes bacterium]|nr:Gfo/Idh/MocA family oxidoreductase [Gemmatimonadota bacterium]